ncbi:terpene synthase family protein [Nocardia terpenica]|uniref:terpene synthase family protein n=1 Tax=Nocardia terpenica TaxID=455432 RepID=UPI0012E716AE|nr:terpene cyclase [Nocardia terpenica]NQE91253.1 terpene cyclase [Nocardia terpenica]
MARLLGVNAVPPTAYDNPASGVAALANGVDTAPGEANPIPTEFARPFRRLLDIPAPGPVLLDRADRRSSDGPTERDSAPSGRTYIEWEYPRWTPLSPDTDRARRANMEWAYRTGMVHSDSAKQWYASWDMAKMTGYLYPYARGERLDLCTDAMAFFFLFDDQFDGAMGRDPGRAAAICEDLIRIVHDPARTRSGPPPIITAFTDVWNRTIDLMSPAWRARAAHNWEYYFSSYPHEATDRIRGSIPSMDRFLHVRRGMGGTRTVLDFCEVAGDFEVNPVAFHSPELGTQRRIIADLQCFCNDVHSVDKEEPRGDVDNLVLVVQKEKRCTRLEAFRHVSAIFDENMKEFDEAGADMYDSLRWLPSADFDNAVRYYKALFTTVCGHHRWEIESLRFANANTVVPATENGYLEDLTTSNSTP